MSTMFTDAIKANEDLTLDVLGLPFGTDRQGQTFDEGTDVGLSAGDAVPVYYYHGFVEKQQDRVGRIGRAVYQGVGSVAGKAGHVFRVHLADALSIAKKIYADAVAGKARASSDSASQFVRPFGIVGKPGRVTSWPIFAMSLMDADLADAAINPNAVAIAAAKAFIADVEDDSLTGEADASKAGAVFAKRNRDRIESMKRMLDEMLQEFPQPEDSKQEAQKAMSDNTNTTPAPAATAPTPTLDIAALMSQVREAVKAELEEAAKAAQRPTMAQAAVENKTVPAVIGPDANQMAAKAFEQYMRTGDGSGYRWFNGKGDQAAEAFYGAKAGDERFPQAVKAALNETTAANGLYLVPIQYSNVLVEAMNYGSLFRTSVPGVNFMTVTGAISFKVPTLTNSTKAILTAEATTYSEVEPTFSEVSFDPYKYTKLVLASEEVLADTRIPLDSIVLRDAGNAFALAENEAFSIGTGSSAPQGIVIGGSVGVTTSATNAITSDEVIDLYHSIAEPYRPGAVWFMKDSTLKAIRKFRENSTTGAYLWQPSLAAGQPETILGRPVVTVPDMAAATTGLKAICFANPSYFSVADFAGLQVQRLNERYAELGQVGFKFYKRFDSNVMLSAASKYLILA